MLQILTDGLQLSKSTVEWLQKAGNEVNDSSLDLTEKASKARRQWKNRNRQAYSEIKKLLSLASKAGAFCCYCEENQATALDHFAPMAFFPELAFDLENLVPACEKCNSHHKREKFALFDLDRKNRVVKLTNVGVSQLPKQHEFALIHPHKDDPQKFLTLKLSTGWLVPLDNKELTPFELKKARLTRDILGLNKRALVDERKDAFRTFWLHLQMITKIKEANSIEQLQRLLPFPDTVKDSRPLPKVKRYILARLKKRILRSRHITVLFEMQRQADTIGLQELRQAIEWVLR